MHITKIFGPPGTGKTTEVLRIMEEALRAGTEPERVAFLTFTREARAQGMDRARLQFGFPKVRLPYFRTLHSIAFKE